jgi:hypothetical protein
MMVFGALYKKPMFDWRQPELRWIHLGERQSSAEVF